MAHHASPESPQTVRLEAQNGVRYTVPTTVRPALVSDRLNVRFRVTGVFKNHFISAYLDDGTRLLHQKKRIMAPGEMEQLVLKKDLLAQYPNARSIIIKVEKD